MQVDGLPRDQPRSLSFKASFPLTIKLRDMLRNERIEQIILSVNKLVSMFDVLFVSLVSIPALSGKLTLFSTTQHKFLLKNAKKPASL